MNWGLEEWLSIQAMYGKNRKQRKENENFISLKNSLLQNSMSGEIRCFRFLKYDIRSTAI